jgi:hypothetical protein
VRATYKKGEQEAKTKETGRKVYNKGKKQNFLGAEAGALAAIK